MDNITHSLTGLMLGRAGLNRWSPYATALLLLSANAPDLDVAGACGGSLDYLHYHRWITHSFFAAPFLALAVVALVRLVARKPIAWGRAYLLALAGVFSHLLLDWTNAYGIRLLLPFSNAWFRLDINGLMDFWIGAALLMAILGPALARLVNAEIGAKSGPHRGPAIFALCFFVLFDGGRFLLHERAVAILDSRLYAEHVPLRVAAFPLATTPLRWKGLVEGANFYAAYEVNVLGQFDPAGGRVFYKPEPSPALEAARQTGTFQEFLRFSQYPFWRVTPTSDPENGFRVEAMDLRFGLPPDPHFVATAIVNAQGKVERSWFALRPGREQ